MRGPGRGGPRARAAGIATAIHYPVPCHRQTAFRRFADEPLPVAEHAADTVLSLPMSSALTTSDVDRVCTVLGTVRP